MRVTPPRTSPADDPGGRSHASGTDMPALAGEMPPAAMARLGLTRETRDTGFLLAVIGWIALLQWGQVPGWTLGMVAVVLGWRGWLAWRAHPLPGWPWRLAVTVLAMAGTIATHRTLLGPEAGVTLVVVLLALKTLELRAQRDAYVIFFLGFFVLLTPLLHSQSLLTALGLLPALWGLLTALVLAQRPLGYPSLWQAARTAGTLLLLGTPLMALLFALFPRLPPLWGIPTDSTIGRSGLSGQMQVGDVARLALDDRIALRVAFPDGAPERENLYFRGPVLRVFDGRRWRPLHGPDAAPEAVGWQRFDATGGWEPGGSALRYEITLEPSLRPWLVTLDGTRQPPEISAGLVGARLQGSPDGQWWLGAPISDVLRYRAEAEPARRWGQQAPRLALQADRELPPGFNPRTLAWAQRLRRELGDPEPAALVEALLRQLRQGGYRYTLEPGLYGRDTADEFWFDRRAGFCEHIASAFVVALRAMDIPARVVTGYQGGERNPIDGLWTVRQRDAHAWTEVWLPDAGWVRIDPTAAVAPQRTLGSERLAPPPGPLLSAVVAVDPRLHATLRVLWEAANQRWNDWVLNYGTTRQLALLRRLGWSAQDWRDVAQALGMALGAGAVTVLVLLWRARPRRADRWQHLLLRAARRWQRRGWPLPQPLTAGALRAAIDGPWRATSAGALPPETCQRWDDWLLALERLRYDPSVDSPQPLSLPALRRALRHLPSPPTVPGHPPFARSRDAADAPSAPTASRRRPLVALLLVIGLAVGTQSDASAQPSPPTYASRADAQALARTWDAEEGWEDAWAGRWLAQARRDDRVRRLILPPPPQAYKNWAAYRARFVEPRRIAAGVRFWNTHAEALQRAQATYGVPAWLIVGIIGVETLYGQHMGKHRALDVLATLALDFPAEHPRASARQAYFTQELRAFLTLARRHGIPPDRWHSSYAGALGLPQFMPSSWLAHAVDFDGDGRIDLTNSAADAIGSVAAFLRAQGWQPGLPVRFDVQPPVDAAQRAVLLAPDIRPTFTVQALREHGAQPAPEADGHPGLLALVELENGDPAQGGQAPTYVLGTDNFYAITRYNQSSYYAMAVIDLGLAVQDARARTASARMQTSASER